MAHKTTEISKTKHEIQQNMAVKGHFILLVLVFICVEGTYDLNIHQLQWLADHMKVKDCRKLVESLHMKTFELEHKLSGKSEPHKSCVNLLVKWDREEGRGKSYNNIVIRLKEMGLADLAGKFTKIVMKEMDDQIDNAFLNDPFKKLIHKDSPLLAEAPRRFPKKSKEPIPTHWNWAQIIGISIMAMIGAVILGVILFHVVYQSDPLEGYKRRKWCRKKDEMQDYFTNGLLEQERRNEEAKRRGLPVKTGVYQPPEVPLLAPGQI